MISPSLNSQTFNPQSIIPELQLLLVDQGLNLLAAIFILVIGWLLAGWAEKLTYRGLGRIPRLDRTLTPLLVKTVRYGILVITLLAVLERFGVQTTSIIALVGAAGLALGLALQGTLSDVAAGVMLLILRPFHVGDAIDASGNGGTVREVGLFATYLTNADGMFVSIPNSKVFSAVIVNYSRAATRRINFVVGIDYADDIEKAQKIALDLLNADPRVLKNPVPMVPVGELGASSVNLIVRCWVSNPDYGDTLFDLQKAVKLAFDTAGISIPFPQQVLAFRADSPNPFVDKNSAKP
ncbi:MAG: mechanosensitive ion channel [Proteobacteria bacterium]|nr:mechanosensitive ion channel [Pseudomonadota bacterium]